MASDTDICNMALSYLGGNSIIEMTDQTTEAELCRLNYATARDAVLEDCNWSFAIYRIVLESPEDPSPIFGFSNAFLLPSTVVRVIEVNDGDDDWALELGRVLINAGRIEVVAIKRVTDPGVFPPSFVTALAARLAAEIALPLTSSPAHQERMIQMYSAKINWAKANDGRQGKSRIRRNGSRFIR